MQAIDCVLFDMGDILYDATAWRKWLHQYLEEKGLLKISYWVLFDIWEEKFLSKIHTAQWEYKEGFGYFLDYLEIPKNEQEALLAINWDIKLKLEKEAKAFPEVNSTLLELKKRGKTIIVLTDTELHQAQVREIIEQRLRIDPMAIDFIASSHEMGWRKPEKEAFEHCVTLSGIPLERAVFVAHDWDELEGAASIHLRTIAYNFREPIEANWKIKQFSELLDIIQ